MIIHEVVIRKDGPIHGIEYIPEWHGYARKTLCGLGLSGLERPKRRRFVSTDGRCGRCRTSFDKAA